MDIIPYLLSLIQSLYQQNCWLFNFICRYTPLKRWAFDDSHSPKYQKFKIDELPLISDFRQEWTYKELIPYYQKRYGKRIRPVSRRSECDIPGDCSCPRCDAPKPFLYKNSGAKGQFLCKVCAARFSPAESRFSSVKLHCPHCGNSHVPKKERKHFILHKCVNLKCPYYLHNLKKADKDDLKDLYNITISHQQIASYCQTAAVCIKPFADQYPYEKRLPGIRQPGGAAPASSLCAWSSTGLQSCLKRSGSSLTATAPVPSPPWNSLKNSAKTLHSKSHR